MYFTGIGPAARVAAPAPPRHRVHRWVTAEDRAVYDPGRPTDTPPAPPANDPVTLAELRQRGLAIGGLADALDVATMTCHGLADTDLQDEADVTINHAAIAMQQLANRWAAAHLRVIGQLDQRQSHRDEAILTAAAYLRHRAHLSHATASDLVHAARRLHHLPHLAAGLAAGDITLTHVLAVTRECTTERSEAFSAADAALAQLAASAPPRDLRVALRRLIDLIDPDGSDADELPPGHRDPRRRLRLLRTIDGLWDLTATLDVLTGEKLKALLDALAQPDDPDTPIEERRSSDQRNHDALDDLCQRAMGLPDLPTIHGRPPHILGMVDLLALAKALGLIGNDIIPDNRPVARLRYTGEISPQLALHLLTEATLTLIQTQGPGRVTNVGRRMRTLPPHLRDVLHMLHTRCRGPGCTRLATWTQAHHCHDWNHGNDTDLNDTLPLCPAHHRLMNQGWTATLNPDTLTATWTTPTGHTITDHP